MANCRERKERRETETLRVFQEYWSLTLRVSSVSYNSAGVTAQMMAVFALPPRDGFRIWVSFESRYGMWTLRQEENGTETVSCYPTHLSHRKRVNL